jgi:hypothetical protein
VPASFGHSKLAAGAVNAPINAATTFNLANAMPAVGMLMGSKIKLMRA